METPVVNNTIAQYLKKTPVGAASSRDHLISRLEAAPTNQCNVFFPDKWILKFDHEGHEEHKARSLKNHVLVFVLLAVTGLKY
jgi:hypothetical protein